MEAMESEGRSVAEAVDSALKKLGLRRDQVEVQILQEPSSGFIGFGAKPARVRISEKRWGPDSPPPAPSSKPKVSPRSSPGMASTPPAPRRAAATPPPVSRRPSPEPAARVPVPKNVERPASAPEKPVDQKAAVQESASLLKDLLELMNFQQPQPTVAWDQVQERVKAVLAGPDVERLTAEGGRALESLQFLTTLMVSRKLGVSVAVQVDALGYWEKKEQEILSLADRAAQEAKSTGKPVRLAPMDATMRRLVHRNLAGNPDIETASEGEGSWRKIVVRPRKR